MVENEMGIPPDFFAFAVDGEPAMLRDDGDLLAAVRRVGLDPGQDLNETFIDAGFRCRFWAGMAGLYDAIHVPKDFDTYAVFSGWDCESTAWLRPARFLRLTQRCPTAERFATPIRATARRL